MRGSEKIRTLINCYYPIGSVIKGQERMTAVFNEGMKHVPNIAG
jgi:hypothetical protein